MYIYIYPYIRSITDYQFVATPMWQEPLDHLHSKDVVLPAFRHAVETSRFREHPEGRINKWSWWSWLRDGHEGSFQNKLLVCQGTLEKNKKEAPLNDENFYEGMVLPGFPRPFVCCFWMFLAFVSPAILVLWARYWGLLCERSHFTTPRPTVELTVSPGSQPDCSKSLRNWHLS